MQAIWFILLLLGTIVLFVLFCGCIYGMVKPMDKDDEVFGFFLGIMFLLLLLAALVGDWTLGSRLLG